MVIVDAGLIKMIYYEPVKVMIDVPDLVDVIINVVIRYHNISKPIVTD